MVRVRDVSERVVGFWESTIQPALRRGEQCLVVAHAHTLRSLIKYLDEIDEKDIEELTIPTGTPLVYSLDRTTLKPVRRRAMTGMRTSHLAIDDVPEIVSPLDENYVGLFPQLPPHALLKLPAPAMRIDPRTNPSTKCNGR